MDIYSKGSCSPNLGSNGMLVMRDSQMLSKWRFQTRTSYPFRRAFAFVLGKTDELNESDEMWCFDGTNIQWRMTTPLPPDVARRVQAEYLSRDLRDALRWGVWHNKPFFSKRIRLPGGGDGSGDGMVGFTSLGGERDDGHEEEILYTVDTDGQLREVQAADNAVTRHHF